MLIKALESHYTIFKLGGLKEYSWEPRGSELAALENFMNQTSWPKPLLHKLSALTVSLILVGVCTSAHAFNPGKKYQMRQFGLNDEGSVLMSGEVSFDSSSGMWLGDDINGNLQWESKRFDGRFRVGGFVSDGIMLSGGLLWESRNRAYEVLSGETARYDVEEEWSSIGFFAGPRFVGELSDPLYIWCGLDAGYLSGDGETRFSGPSDSFSSRGVSEVFVQTGAGLKFAIGKRHGAFLEFQAAVRFGFLEEETSMLLNDEPVSVILSFGGGGFFNTN